MLFLGPAISTFTQSMNYFGLDIGGTKCAVSRLRGDGIVEETHRVTTGGAKGTLQTLFASVATLDPGPDPVFGISCGGPLDAERGVVSCNLDETPESQLKNGE